MTELQSALLLRRQLAGERGGGGAPDRAGPRSWRAAARLSSRAPWAGGRPAERERNRRGGPVPACKGGEPEAPVPAGPCTSSRL